MSSNNKIGMRRSAIALVLTMMLLFVALALVNSAMAFTASNNANEIVFSTGQISSPMSSSDMSISAELVSTINPVALYSNAFNGRLGAINDSYYSTNTNSTNSLEEDIPITISAIYPNNNAVILNTTPTFIINSTGNLADNCSLFLDSTLVSSIYPLQNGLILFDSTLASGKYDWYIECFDSFGHSSFTSERKLTILKASKFDRDSTDLTTANLSSVVNLTLANTTAGKVIFASTVNLSRGVDLDNNIEITSNSITVNSAEIPELNVSAVITFYDLGIQKPVILRNGVYCADCSILSYNSRNLTFNVSHFSTYTISENSRLEVSDETDTQIKYLNQKIWIYANFSNTTSGVAISGAGMGCNITVAGSTDKAMAYNSLTHLYEYNRSFSQLGITYYNVSCYDSSGSYTNLNVTDHVTISMLNGISPADNIEILNTSRSLLDNPPVTIDASGGNMSLMTIEGIAITSSWQGYYGNINGKIILNSVDNHSLYNWEIISPKGQIYATRYFDVDFTSVNCTSDTGIQLEQSYLGQSPTQGDSVNSTFSSRNHPSFRIATANIPSDSCRSTNLYVNDTAQNETFYELLMSDAADNLLYVSLLESDKFGFTNETMDFQIIVGENGADENPTPYFFFVEIT